MQENPLDKLLIRAETAHSLPPEPEGGIPKQWLPGWIRWPLKVLILPWILLDFYSQKFAAFLIKPPYKKIGHCLKRGNCCHYILIPADKGLLGRLLLFFNTQVNGFFLRSQEPYTYGKDRILVMGCRYLKKDGGCAHYHLRPMVCRKWPQIEYFGQPRLLKGCGFKAIPRNEKNTH
jgi:hypothetical protein